MGIRKVGVSSFNDGRNAQTARIEAILMCIVCPQSTQHAFGAVRDAPSVPNSSTDAQDAMSAVGALAAAVRSLWFVRPIVHTRRR